MFRVFRRLPEMRVFTLILKMSQVLPRDWKQPLKRLKRREKGALKRVFTRQRSLLGKRRHSKHLRFWKKWEVKNHEGNYRFLGVFGNTYRMYSQSYNPSIVVPDNFPGEYRKKLFHSLAFPV